MKKYDLIWILIFLLLSFFVIFSPTRAVFEQLTENYPYLMGFFKTAILASMGERLVHRIKNGHYFGDDGIIFKAMIWGFLGMVFVVIFKIFASGVQSAQASGLLPVLAQQTWVASLWTAFLMSFMMNVFFAPTFMLLHRVTDQYIELGEGKIKNIMKVPFHQVVEGIDLSVFLSFVVMKTIPLFWIPAHTITFLLPENYRVLMAAYLSIALGFILTMSKSRKHHRKNNQQQKT